MPAHQPRDCLGLFRRKPKPRAELECDLLADDRVIAAAALRDAVQQYRKVKSTARYDRPGQLSGERVLIPEFAALDLMQDADREKRVLVNGVVMVHVVLHLGDDAPEIRDEAAEQSSLVHPAQGGFRIL